MSNAAIITDEHNGAAKSILVGAYGAPRFLHATCRGLSGLGDGPSGLDPF
jgi:hypothetical protein